MTPYPYPANMILISEPWLKEILYSHYLGTVIAYLAGILTGIACIWLGSLLKNYLKYKFQFRVK